MSRYRVIIEQIHPLLKSQFPYKVTVFHGNTGYFADSDYAMSKWGARRLGTKIIKLYEKVPFKAREIESYVEET